ncbi:MAG: hypothetical protein IKE43_01030 [Coriobacteriales bacterium]|nr:hypothetical protein [Coriobacteriales bacterium]
MSESKNARTNKQSIDYMLLDIDQSKTKIKILSNPGNYIAHMAQDNVGYQMQYSISSLEKILEKEGNPHVLQMNCQGSRQEPIHWMLYADGIKVASGTGTYAKECFIEAAEKFRDICREAVEAANLPHLSEHDYWLLKRAQAIASLEPFDNGSHIMGSKKGRVF